MLKTLIKKEYQECFRAYFINAKKGTARSRKGTIGLFVLFGGLMLFLMAFFFGMSYLLGKGLLEADLAWLFFALMGILSISLGVFGSVFNTYATLYLAKDNEMLLSMPIPPSTILTARISLVLGLSFLYSGIVWVPASIYGCIFGNYSVAGKIMGLILFPAIALLVTSLTCALGWIVAFIASRVKNKSFVIVFLTLILMGAYYYVCGNMSNIMTLILANVGKVQSGMKKWGNLFYQLGKAASGSGKAMLIFCGITLILTLVCFYLLAHTFTGIVTRSSGTTNRTEKVKTGTARSMKKALLYKELKRFTSSPTYMLNCGLGIVLLLLSAVMSLVRRETIRTALTGILVFLPVMKPFLPLVVLFGVCMISAVDTISTPSISLEGKNLWVLQTLPVSGKDVLEAKLMLHLMLSIVPALLGAASLSFCLNVGFLEAVLVLIFIILFLCFHGALGLIIGVLRPNFTWTSEAMPIKQSLNVLIIMLVCWLLLIVYCGAYYFAWKVMSVRLYLSLGVVLMALLSTFTIHWLLEKGAVKFETL